MKKILMLLMLVLFPTLIACNDSIPAGQVASCMTSAGFGPVTGNGTISCWGAAPSPQLYYVEVADNDYGVRMNVLCKDSLNFSFHINVLAATNVAQVHSILKQVPAKNLGDNKYLISGQEVFNRYAKNLIDQEARRVVSRYETAEIVVNRERILVELQKGLAEAFKDNKMIVIKRVTVNNLQFPEVITKAQEQRAQRQVEIETEKAEQSKRRLKLLNQMELAEANAKIALIEAQVVADTNQIIGSSITPGYLAWYQTRVFSEAAQGPNNWGFIPYNADVGKNQDIMPLVLDAATRKRLEATMNKPLSFEAALQAQKAEEEAKAQAQAQAQAKQKEIEAKETKTPDRGDMSEDMTP